MWEIETSIKIVHGWKFKIQKKRPRNFQVPKCLLQICKVTAWYRKVMISFIQMLGQMLNTEAMLISIQISVPISRPSGTHCTIQPVLTILRDDINYITRNLLLIYVNVYI